MKRNDHLYVGQLGRFLRLEPHQLFAATFDDICWTEVDQIGSTRGNMHKQHHGQISLGPHWMGGEELLQVSIVPFAKPVRDNGLFLQQHRRIRRQPVILLRIGKDQLHGPQEVFEGVLRVRLVVQDRDQVTLLGDRQVNLAAGVHQLLQQPAVVFAC